jgi:glycosyltransferase involved in cell wall biosynthesis
LANRNQNLSIAVIVTTYNRPDALRVVLEGYLAQQDQIFELLVADDGSKSDTADLVKEFQQRASFKISHVWHEDDGFRAAAIRNRALATTQAEYVIFTDGDCVPRSDFIGMQRSLAEEGWFLSGNRLMLSQNFTQEVIQQRIPIQFWKNSDWKTVRDQGGIERILPLLTVPLGDLRKITPRRWKGAKTCNLSAFRNDLIRVNGLDESYVGWGMEDSDLVVRLIRAGVFNKSARFSSPVFHLWHPENDRSHLAENQRRLRLLIEAKHIRAKVGLDRY